MRPLAEKLGVLLALGSLLGCASIQAQPVDSSANVEVTSTSEPQGASVTLLGTAGGPPPHLGRFQPSSVLQIGERKYLIDAGEGAGYQLHQAGVSSRDLDAVFLTHLHWDHTLGLGYLMATSWMRNRNEALPVHGPPGLDLLMSRQLAAIEVGEDIFRSQATQRPRVASLYPSVENAECEANEVYRDETVTVTAVCNSHFSAIASLDHSYGEDRALSYRFDSAEGSVTFSGDTGPSKALEDLAQGSDVLVIEIVDLESIERSLEFANPGGDHSVLMTHMEHQHLTPQEVGKLATRAGVGHVVLNHFVIGQGFNPEQFAQEVDEFYDGMISVGHDLDVIQIGSQG